MSIKKYYYGGYAAIGSAMLLNISKRPQTKPTAKPTTKPTYGASRLYLDRDWDGESLGLVYIGNKGWVGITPSGRVGYKTSNGYVPIKNLTNYDKQLISLAINKTGVKALTGDRSREVANAWAKNSKTWLAASKPSTNLKPLITLKPVVTLQEKPNVGQKPTTLSVGQAKPTRIVTPQPRINNSAEGQRIMAWLKRLGVKADGWWGKDTTAAYNTWKSKLQLPTSTVNLNTPESNGLTTDITNSPHIASTAPLNLGTSAVNLNTPTSEEISSIKTPAPVTLDRSQIRDWLRNRNINPYSLAGSERSALRLYINGATTGYDINIVRNLNSKYNLGFKFKQGGQMHKYQQGGQAQLAGGLQGVEQQAIALVQAAMQGDLKATQTILLIMQAAQQGDQQAMQVALLLQAVMQKMKGSRKARLGAKLNYLNKSIGDCPEGQEVVYFKKGGELCKACQKMLNGGNPIEEFKRRKLTVTKHLQGGSFKLAFDNAYGKQRYFTWNGKVYAAYKGDKATDRGFQGAVDNLQEQANALKDYNRGSHLGWNPGTNKNANFRHNASGTMVGVLPEVTVTAKRMSPKLKANNLKTNNLRKQYFDQWTAYVKKWHPNMIGRFKNTMQNMGYNYNWNTGTYDKNGKPVYRLSNGLLQTQNIYTGNWNNINNSDALPGMPANGLAIRMLK